MGKIGRIACIATPGVLTVASLLCLLIVFLAGQNKNDANLRSLYFFRADTTSLKQNVTKAAGVTIAGHNIDPKIMSALENSVKGNLSDWYEIYLWNYCSGKNTSSVPTFCSPRTAQFYFNPIDVWGLSADGLSQYIPSELNKGLSVYAKVSKWLFVAYTIAFWTTVGAFAVGFFAICSRWGSLVTTIVIGVSTLFTILAAITSTILFSTLSGAFNTALRPYGIHLSVGTKMLALEWIAVAFSLGAALFWFVSICCCSGKSNHPFSRDAYNKRGRRGEKNATTGSSMPFGKRGYQPLGEGQQQWGAGTHGGHEMDNFGGSSPYKGRETAYEPFRHERV